MFGQNELINVFISITCALLFLSLSMIGKVQAEDSFTIQSSTQLSHDGRFNISWKLPESSKIELQQSRNSDAETYTTIYQGFDLSTVITGFSNGQYHYRARLIKQTGQASNWSPVITIDVQHHSLSKALIFFGIGLIVFLSTLLLIVLGNKKHQHGFNNG